ncbi:uncharacterized protein LOC131207513 [Anopheles bellator]|uniref:uncharacterized protein LOC131207513 n=1 Tax=Anopheles bellator TaxID=139047 RepID=UPI002648EFC8|nr:uncharacterized protein LOC131207513 [Anopheles bellator]
MDDIITQGKCLCGQYIRCRLKRPGPRIRSIFLPYARRDGADVPADLRRNRVPVLLSVIARNLFKVDVTWGKVV